MMMSKIHVSLLFLMTLIPLWAQYPDETKEEEAPTLKLTFSVFPLDSGNWTGIFFAPKGEPSKEIKEVFFNRSERSITYEYKGPSPLVFFRTTQNEEGETLYQPVASVSFPPEPTKQNVILFFEPQKEKKDGPYDVSVMPDQGTEFPKHSIVFFNTMDVPFIGMLAEHRLMLPPGTSEVFDVSGFLSKDVPIILAIRNDEDLHLVARNQIRFSPERRTLMILRPPKRKGSLRIRTQRLTEFTGKRGEDEPPPETTSE